MQRVHHCGLAGHPSYEPASCQQRRYGGVLVFEVAGGREAAWQCIDTTALMPLTANPGDVKTTIVHPAKTAHGRLSEQQRKEAGINQSPIRIALGFGDIDGPQADCDRRLAAAHRA